MHSTMKHKYSVLHAVTMRRLGGCSLEQTGDVVLDAIAHNQLVEPSDLERAHALADESDEKVEHLLVQIGALSETDLAEIYCSTLGLSRVKTELYPQEPLGADTLSSKFLIQEKVLPISISDNEAIVALADPRNENAIDGMTFAFGRKVMPAIGTRSEIEEALYRLYDLEAPGEDLAGTSDDDLEYSEDASRLRDLASEAPIVRLVNAVIARAVDASASDIHIEPLERRMRIRLRIDGVLQEIESPPLAAAAAIVSRTKIMANLDIAERRLPQDGRIKVVIRGKPIDLRVSTVPTNHGESVVLRILDRGSLELDFATLGFDKAAKAKIDELLAFPHGVFLVTGPTGSGKSTTLYTALAQLNTKERKILTIEDPIEYVLEGINQSQVNPDIGRTFAQALRSFLRQDPDVMMVGEIRDKETADIGIQSSLTGHLVLSTLHTNDAIGAVTRLIDMGVDDYLITSSVIGLMSQRLVRKLCPSCRTPYDAPGELVQKLGLKRVSNQRRFELFAASGCADCHETGYRGRVAILEIVQISDDLRSLILRRATQSELKQQAIADGMRPLFEDGLRKALAGETTVDEVLRVTRDI